jgi:probable F420-dependent oxidoreductase
MTARRPFRFGVIGEHMTTRQRWLEQARRAEALGYATLLIRDHFVPDFFGDQFAPFSALMAAADATTTLRVGNLVIDNDYRHPVILAKEAATLDLLSEGRFELGLGAGWLQAEYEQAGLPFDPPGVRIGRMEEAIQVLKGLFADGPLNFAGAHYAIAGLDGLPKPVQRPLPPLLIGGAGKRMLGIAGREADIVHFLPRTIDSGTLLSDPRDRLSGNVAEKVGWLQESAGKRFDQIELSLGATIIVADDRLAATEQLIRVREWKGMSVEEVWDMPSLYIGSVEQIVADLQQCREVLGFSYFIVPDEAMDACAPIVARLGAGM